MDEERKVHLNVLPTLGGFSFFGVVAVAFVEFSLRTHGTLVKGVGTR